MKIMPESVLRALLPMLLAAWPAVLHAQQSFPLKPVRFVTGATPGTTPDILAQNESFLDPPCGWGAFKCDPVSRLYLARPFSVRPAPLETGNFSPRPTAREGPPSLCLAVFAD